MLTNWLGLAAIAWGVLAPLATWGLTEGKYRLIEIPNARAAAVRTTTDALNKEFNKRLAALQAEFAEKAAEARRLADEAAASIGPTPVEKAKIVALCQQSASCRDRNKPTGDSQ